MTLEATSLLDSKNRAKSRRLCYARVCSDDPLFVAVEGGCLGSTFVLDDCRSLQQAAH